MRPARASNARSTTTASVHAARRSPARAWPTAPHTFAVRATDTAGNTDPSPATRSFTVDTTAYQAKISKVSVKGPAKVRKGKKATYKVKVTNSGNIDATGVKLRGKGRGVKAKKSVGKIAAGKAKTVKLKLKPKKPGKFKAAFKVTSGNAGGRTAKKTITVKKWVCLPTGSPGSRPRFQAATRSSIRASP